MMFFIEDSKAGQSLGRKMVNNGRVGALIPCSTEEMEAAKSMHVINTDSTKSPATLIPVESDQSYLLECDYDKVNIADIKSLNINVQLLRYKW